MAAIIIDGKKQPSAYECISSNPTEEKQSLTKDDVDRNLNNVATTLLFGITTKTATSLGQIENTYSTSLEYLETDGSFGKNALKSKLEAVLSSRFKDLTSKKYENPELLGKGSEGIVFLATSTKDHKPYAIKILAPVDQEKEVRELDVHHSLEGRTIRHLVPRSESFQIDRSLLPKGLFSKTKQVHVLATNFLGKTTLKKALETENWDLKKARKFARSILEFFEDFHQEYIHTDMSPENIIVAKGDFHVIDLGSSFKMNGKKAINPHTFYLTKRPYRSPFGLLITSSTDHAQALRKNIDYYALGIMLLEIFLKENPFTSLDACLNMAKNKADPVTIELIRLHTLSEITPLSQEFIKAIPAKTRAHFFQRKSERHTFVLKPFPFAESASETEKNEVLSLLKNFKKDLDAKLEQRFAKSTKKSFEDLKEFIFGQLLSEKKLEPEVLKKHAFLKTR